MQSWRAVGHIALLIIGTLCCLASGQGHLTANAAAVSIAALLMAGLLMVIDLLCFHQGRLEQLAASGYGRQLEGLLAQALATALAPVLARLEAFGAAAGVNPITPAGAGAVGETK